MSEQQYTKLNLINELNVLINMEQLKWTLEGYQDVLWFELTPYYKRFIRIAVNDIVHALSLSQSFQSLQQSHQDSFSNPESDFYCFQWYDPKFSPFTFMLSSTSPNIETSPEKHLNGFPSRFTAVNQHIQVDVREETYPNTNISYFAVYFQVPDREVCYYGKFNSLQDALILGEDLVADPNSHPPVPEIDFSSQYAEVTFANEQTYYLHEVYIKDEIEPSYQWLISKEPVSDADILLHSKFSYYRKDGLSQHGTTNIRYLGDMKSERIIANAVFNKDIADSLEKAFKQELAS